MTKNSVELAKSVLDIEAQAILAMKDRISETFVKAAELIFASKGKLVISGMGKSGQIGRKLASTFSSTGSPAVYLHPSESGHGDLGLISKDDVVLGISYGGDSAELTPLLNYVQRKNIPMIAMTGKASSQLAKAARHVLDVSVLREACPLGLAPTASSTATLALGDALAMVVLEMRGFSAADFAEIHPGGGLGFKLARVREIMHSVELPVVQETTPIRQVLTVMTHRDVRGAAGVVDQKGDLIGIVTDGVIRKRLESQDDLMQGTAQDLMTVSPKTIDAEEFVEKALFLMEQFRINQLFVLDSKSSQPRKPVGLLHIQDLLRAKVR